MKDLNYECPECTGEGAYFNGVNYECPNCGYEWDDNELINHGDEYVNKDNEFDDCEKVEKWIELQDESRVGVQINRNSFIALYSPSWQYEKERMLDICNGFKSSFEDKISSELLSTRDFSAIHKITPPVNLSKSQVSDIIEREVKNFLESRDELPFSPTVKEWSQYINAPESFIEKIIPKGKPGIVIFLPFTDEGGFTALFSKRIDKLFGELKKKKEIVGSGSLTRKDLKNIFAMLADGERDNCWENPLIIEEVDHYFKKELQMIKQYRIDVNNWKNGSLDEFITEAINKRMSTIDAVVLVLESYFKDLMN